MKKNLVIVQAIALLALFLWLSPTQVWAIAQGDMAWCAPDSWQAGQGMLQPDPEIRYGRLANGLQYLIKKHQEPKHRVALLLSVKVGSLNEEENERGIAHFLEHLMFRGTDHFAPGTLVEYFQSIGMEFGGDANAQTGFDETIYNLFLPTGEKSDLERGFLIFTDFARRATIAESQVEEERGVILAEKRDRDSPEYRNQVAEMNFAFRGTRVAERMVIGEDRVIERAGRKDLKKFYDRWYRPENMVLVLVGDTNVDLAEGLIKKSFSTLKAASKVPVCPEFGKIYRSGESYFYHYEPELGKTTVSISSYWNKEPEVDTLEKERKELLQTLAGMIVGYRLQQLEEREGTPLIKAYYNTDDFIKRIGYGEIQGQVTEENWQKGLSLLHTTLSQIISQGFSDNEVDRGKKEIIALLDKRAVTAETEDSRRLAERLLRDFRDGNVLQSPIQERENCRQLLATISVDQINKEVQAVWGHGNRQISVSGNVNLGNEGETIVRQYYQQMMPLEIDPWSEQQSLVFPYLMANENKNIVPITKEIKDIDALQYRFPNGLIVNTKKTEFQNNTVLVKANFGNGKLSEPQPGMALLTEVTMNSSGTGRLAQSAIDQAISASSVQLHFSIGEAAFSYSGSALTKDIELLLQLLQTKLLDPGFRNTQFDMARKKAESYYKDLEHDVEGALSLQIIPYLAGNNGLIGLPPWSEVEKIQFSQAMDWMHTFSQLDDLEISVVGDFAEADILSLIKKYFGNINLKKNQETGGRNQLVLSQGGFKTFEVDTTFEKSMVVTVWPTDDFWNIDRTRKLHLLADILEDRLRKVVRDQLGAAYSPSVSSYNSQIFSGFGYIMANIVVQPDLASKISQAIDEVAEQMVNSGITEEELIRAKKPRVTSIADLMRTNQYWLSSVLSQSSRHPEQLNWPHSMVAGYDTTTKESLETLAKQYLQNNRAVKFIVRPKGVIGK